MVFFIISIGPRQLLVGVNWVISNQQKYNSNKCEKNTFSVAQKYEILILKYYLKSLTYFNSSAYVFKNQTIVHFTITNMI